MSLPSLPDNKNTGMSQNDIKSFMSLVASQEEKTRIYIMEQLLKQSNLEFITEYPNFTYTKAMTRFATWRTSAQEVFNLTEGESDVIVQAMTQEFMKKNVSHKRRRAHEIVNALRSEDASSNVLDHEHKGMRKFLGLR